MITLFLFFLCDALWAHDQYDWRSDYEAYLSLKIDPRPLVKGVQKQPGRIDLHFFKEKLLTFASIERSTNQNLDTSRKFLTEEYKKIGFEVSYYPFGTGTNFVAEKKGIKQPEKILILSSHIDSVGNKGANDNGTGTIGALSIARELAKSNFNYTIRVLGFDREERGLLGSDAYVAAIANKKDIVGNINIEMIGHHARKDGAFHLIDCERPYFIGVSELKSAFLSQEVKTSIANLGLDLRVVKACTDRSDHASFWRHKIPAIVVSENFFGGDDDPCYHARCDVVDDRLNYPYMQMILEALLDATERILQKQ